MFRFTLARKLSVKANRPNINWFYCKPSAVWLSMLMVIVVSWYVHITIETEWATHNIQHSTSTCVIVQRAPNCYISIVNNYAIYWHFTMTNWIFKFFLFTLFISLARSFWPRSLKEVDQVHFVPIHSQFHINIWNFKKNWFEVSLKIIWKVV